MCMYTVCHTDSRGDVKWNTSVTGHKFPLRRQRGRWKELRLRRREARVQVPACSLNSYVT